MFDMVARDRCRARTMPVRSPLSRVTPALSIATSVPELIARPTSAAASAGASLTPSPAIATTRPSCRSRLTTSLLWSGSTSASTRSMPSRLATASAVTRLSPVSMTTSIRSRRSTSRAVGVVLRDGQTGITGGVDDGEAERVLGSPFDARGEPEQLVPVEPAGGDDPGDRRLTFGQGAGLVDDERVHLL